MKERARQRHADATLEQPKASANGETTLRDAVLELQRTAGNSAVDGLLGARPLDPGLRGALEERFDADLSHVRLHADADGARHALEERAAAVTTGADVHFAPGRYQPATQAGRTLIAHEIAHVVQQTRNAGGPLLGSAGLEAEAEGGGAVAGRAARGTALHADEQVLEDAKRDELKRLLTADKDSWMDYLDHPVYSQILHDDLEIGRSLVGDPRFRRWLDDPSYRPKEIAKVTPATKPIQSSPAVEQAPLSPGNQPNWGKEWERMSGEERARSAIHPSKVPELPPVPVYYTREMAELDAMPGVFRHVPGAEIGWRSAELAWGETAGTGLQVDREEKAKELAVVIGKEVVMNWAAGRVVKGVTTLDELRSLALAADEAAQAALRPTTTLIPGRVPVRGSGLLKPPAPRGAGATAVKSVKPPPWKAPPPSFKAGGGGGVGMQLQLEPVPQAGGVGVGVRPSPVFEPTPRPTEGTAGGKTPTDVPGRFQDSVQRLAKTSAKPAPSVPEKAPGTADPQGGKGSTIWLPGLHRHDVELPPARRQEPITEKETPPPLHIDPTPEQTIDRIDPLPEGGAERMELAGKSTKKTKKPTPKKKPEETSLEGDPSDPTPVMDPGEESRYVQYSPEANREAKFRRQWMVDVPKGGGTIKWGHTSRTYDENKNLLEESTTLLEPGVRDQQALQGLPGAKAGDEAGHLLRIAFGHVDAVWGKGGVVPQARKVNTGGGAWWRAENDALKAAVARQRAGQFYRIRSEAKGFTKNRPSHTRISVEDENAVPVYDSGWIRNP